jgi:hypothetical protein
LTSSGNLHFAKMKRPEALSVKELSRTWSDTASEVE